MVEKNREAVLVSKAESAQNELPESMAIPSKFRKQDGTINVMELLKSYLALERKLAERSQKNILQNQKGFMPASADEYQIDLKASGLTIDPEINRRLFELGFTQEQVQAVYDLAAEKVVPVIQQLAADYRTDRELADLEKEFGGADRFNQVARQIFLWGQQNLDSDVFQALSCSKEGILTMYKMMNSNEPVLLKEKANQREVVSEEELRKMMQDPRYWKQNDPAFVKKIEDGFKKLYG